MSNHRGLYIMGISIHGLVRGRDPELGRDADTGGQVKYVVEWARALSANPAVDRVDLLTRRIAGRGIDPSYGEPVERIAEKAYIVRIPFGPRRYLYKESLWPYLDLFSDQALQYVAHLRRSPDLIHGHYADAGYAGSQMARLLGVPFVFTGHSLGRVKRQRLMADGADEHALDVRYRFPLRIEAEEIALDTAALVVASTRQEVEQQYARYDHYEPRRMRVIPPGVDLAQFHPPQDGETPPPVVGRIERFLADPRRPAVLAMARPDERKNFARLIEAFALRPGLRDRANLVLILGCRDDIREMDPASRRVLTGVLALVDRHDLYGSAAYPKRHEAGEVPALYRWAAGLHGVFVNPALTEPFGLTLIEAAASGLPVVATSDGGPRDILAACRNGLLVDPLDPAAIGEAIDGALSDPARWREWSANGIAGAHRHYAWTSHVRSYLEVIESLGATSQNAGAWP
ncbi:MAG: glycosyltransferase, partial [Verrucomicrobia bacterium]|nr:glycosyltransferase [Verrucomicrobiota bacterium]